MRRHTPFALCALCAGAAGCQALEPPPLPPQIISIRVESDPGKPLRGAQILYQGEKKATTGADGVGKLELGGRDGESFDIEVSCPARYLSPERPIQVILKRLADPSKSPEYSASCPPKTRTVVVAIRADGGPNAPVGNMPVTYLGREIARTDESGAAHFVRPFTPGETFDLVIDTRDKQYEGLRPQNPMATFVVGQRDDIFTFDQKFDREQKRIIRAGKPKPTGPVKIP
jgi:hypothetical protein